MTMKQHCQEFSGNLDGAVFRDGVVNVETGIVNSRFTIPVIFTALQLVSIERCWVLLS
jgi:hypothetical protein